MYRPSDHAFDNVGIQLLSAAFGRAWVFVEGDVALEPLAACEHAR